MTTINTFVTHAKPHLDEIVAIWLLQKFGSDHFPGSPDAAIQLVENFDEAYPNQDADHLEKNGILCIGVGGGRFDEHLKEGGRKKGVCAATLVAYALQIDQDPALKQILDYVLQSDTQGGKETAFSMALMVKKMNDYQNVGQVIDWVEFFLDAKYEEQIDFYNALREVEEKGQRFEVNGFKGVLTIVSITSDNPLISQAARFKGGKYPPASVVIHQDSSGNVGIYPNANDRLTFAMRDTVKMLRIEEQKTKGALLTTDWKELASAGTVVGAEEWYFADGNGDFILNGSKSHHVDPTHLTLEKITELVAVGLAPKTFDPSRSTSCLQDRCHSSKHKQCPFYEYGLHRCTSMRHRAHQARMAAQ